MYEAIVNFEAMTTIARSWLAQELPRIVPVLARSGTSPADIKLIQDLPFAVEVKETPSGIEAVFGNMERNVISRALEYGSSTRHIPRVRLLTRLGEQLIPALDQELTRATY